MGSNKNLQIEVFIFVENNWLTDNIYFAFHSAREFGNNSEVIFYFSRGKCQTFIFLEFYFWMRLACI